MQNPKISWIMLLASVWACVSVIGRADDPPGRIRGMLTTENAQAKCPGHAAVFVCEAKTGYPLLAANHKPASDKNSLSGDLDSLWHAVTEADGSFAFDGVPPGQYRLIAQSWAGERGVPDQRNTSEVILLHGVAEGVIVQTSQTAQAFIRPLGAGILSVENDPQEAGAYLFASAAPPLGDSVLGIFGWGREFPRQIIGVTHMTKPRAIFFGLPEDREVHLSIFCYDNSPGFGGGSFRAGVDKIARLKIFAGWSNGHDEPTTKLLPLVNYIENYKASLAELTQLPRDEFFDKHGNLNIFKLWSAGDKELEKKITIAAVGDFRVIDIIAADAYKNLRQSHRAKRERFEKQQKEADKPPKSAPPAGF